MALFIYGKNSVQEAIEQNIEISVVYTLSHLDFLKNKNFKVVICTKNELDKKVNFANHQGIVAETPDYNYADINYIIKQNPPVILVLDHVQDPQNLGAIIRTANAAGVKDIVIPKDRAAQITPAVLKVASGGIANMNIAKVASLFDFITKMKSENYWIYATALSESAKSFKDVVYNQPAIIVVGNEQKGVSATILKSADEIVSIPMKGSVESLNVATATGIILFSM